MAIDSKAEKNSIDLLIFSNNNGFNQRLSPGPLIHLTGFRYSIYYCFYLCSHRASWYDNARHKLLTSLSEDYRCFPHLEIVCDRGKIPDHELLVPQYV